MKEELNNDVTPSSPEKPQGFGFRSYNTADRPPEDTVGNDHEAAPEDFFSRTIPGDAPPADNSMLHGATSGNDTSPDTLFPDAWTNDQASHQTAGNVPDSNYSGAGNHQYGTVFTGSQSQLNTDASTHNSNSVPSQAGNNPTAQTVTNTPGGTPYPGYTGSPQTLPPAYGNTYPSRGMPPVPPGAYPPPFQSYPYPQQPPPPKKKNTALKVFLWTTGIILCLLTIIIICILAIPRNGGTTEENSDSKLPNNSFGESTYIDESSIPEAPVASADPNGPQISTITESIPEGDTPASKAYRKAAPSIVCITSYAAGSDYTLSQKGEGSGIVISKDGYIATNSHVVSDSKNTGVMITLSDGRQFLGTIIGIDKKTDLAVIKVAADDLTPAEFADSDKLFVGQEAYALGNPGGAKFSNSLTKGTISAINRLISANSYIKYIQTDAAINPGNSGGALINDNGQVIGMNTAKLVGTDYEGMGFAIPGNKVAEIVNILIKYGYVNNRGTLGIEATTCDLFESKKRNVPQGVIISKISTDSPLRSTSALESDIITGINGTTIRSFSEFVDELNKYRPGDTVNLTLFRPASEKSKKSYSINVDVVLKEDTGE